MIEIYPFPPIILPKTKKIFLQGLSVHFIISPPPHKNLCCMIKCATHYPQPHKRLIFVLYIHVHFYVTYNFVSKEFIIQVTNFIQHIYTQTHMANLVLITLLLRLKTRFLVRQCHIIISCTLIIFHAVRLQLLVSKNMHK